MRIRVAIATPGGDSERTPEFTKPEISIGRMPSNDVVLPEAGVSSTHARVLVTGSTLTILDLNSTNGTYVNEEPLRGPRVIRDEDEVQIGDFVLRFSLEGSASDTAAFEPVPTAVAERKGGTREIASAGWPDEPPPMLDELGLAMPPDSGPHMAAPRSATPVFAERRPAVFPPLESPAAVPVASANVASRPPSRPAERGGDEAFAFSPAPPDVLVDRVFAAVWARVAEDVLQSMAGADQVAAALLDDALRAAGRVGKLPPDLRGRMLAEMIGDGPVRSLLEGDPDDVLVHGTTRVRINRAGHVAEGPSPFTCPSAVASFVVRACRVPFDGAHPSAHGSFGAYALEAVVGASGPVLSLRRSTTEGRVTLESLVHAGILSHNMASLLATCVVARQSILLCGGPGASVRPLMAGLMACGAAQELQVVVGHRGLEAAMFRPGTIVIGRHAGQDDLLESALALAPDRLGVDDLQWNEARGVVGLVSRSLGMLLGVRAQAAAVGLAQLEAMLGAAVPNAALGALLGRSIDLVLAVQLFADGVSRVTQLAEPIVYDNGTLGAQDLFALVPGSRTWQFSGVQPRCVEELGRRGFRIDPAILA